MYSIIYIFFNFLNYNERINMTFEKNNIIKDKYTFEKIGDSELFSGIYLPQKRFLINDSRKLMHFKSQTFGGYKKTEVNSQLDKAIQAEDLDKSIYLGFQLLFSGYINQLWEKLISIVFKNININNPTIPKFLYYKQKLWDSFILDKKYKKDNIFLLRNNILIRELIVELICIIILSRKRKLETLKKITNKDFNVSFFKSKLEAKDNNLSSSYLKEDDPSEIRIAFNEFTYQMKERNFDKVLYWLSWIIEWDKLNTKKYGKFNIASRVYKNVEPKFSKNVIWLIWDYINLTKDKLTSFDDKYTLSENDKNQIEYLWKLFCLNYSNSKRNKRISLVIWALKILNNPLDYSIELINKKYLLFQSLANYNFMIEKIKLQENNTYQNSLSGMNIVIKNNYIQTENYKKIQRDNYEKQYKKQMELREKEAKKKKISINSLNKLDALRNIDRFT